VQQHHDIAGLGASGPRAERPSGRRDVHERE
jgi:hypothetical protein